MPSPDSAGPARVAVVVPVGEAERPRLSALCRALGGQAGVRLEVLLVDATAYGGLLADLPELSAAAADAGGAVELLRVLRGGSPSRGAAVRQALAATRAPLVALGDPRVPPEPERLARQAALLAARPAVALVTCGVRVEAAEVGPAERAPGAPPDFSVHAPDATATWAAAPGTLLARREALAGLDATCFAPAERGLLLDARAAGRAAHLGAPLARAAPADVAGLVETARVDEELLRLAAAAPADAADGAPEVTVLLAHYRRGDVLMECLAGFARQLVPPGTLEIVVCDDGSGDGSAEWARELELGVPYTLLEQPNAGACAARNRALPHARGRLVLFVNDDTIPFPDTVAGHLAAHAELGERAAVLGTFEQPPEEREKAIVRLLEGSGYVFGYAGFEPGAELDGVNFYTCNASVPRAAVERLGAFDPELPCFGEDTEYGVRLVAAGYRLVFRPEIRALHRHVQGYELLRWRQPAVARAHVRLFEKHPDLIDDAWGPVDAAEAAEKARAVEPHLPGIEAAARALADVRLAALERAGGALHGTAERIAEQLAELVGKLNGHWWLTGFAEELGARGLSGFPELLAAAPLPLAAELAAAPRREILRADPVPGVHAPGDATGDGPGDKTAEPRWPAVAERWLADPRTRGRALVVWADPRVVDLAGIRAVAAALERRAAEAGELADRRLAVVAAELGRWTRVRIFAACDAWVRCGDAEDAADAAAADAAGVRERELAATASAEPLEVPRA